ncbi:hypothetical protein JXA27_06760 [Aerococcaceae bacterium zg-B36]|uniref:hypothetical protein n=1 Tax=Aerococcaceae bacterium zg-252 TaxID=2796928 RepID=UPI001BD81CA1|nr:hypothetical protein [Aerococcaceae bacterium zg-B36]
MEKFVYTVTYVDIYDASQSQEHGTYNSFDEAFRSIKIWWKANNFEPYYVRIIDRKDVKIIDYGNHNGFYHIIEKPVKKISFRNIMQRIRELPDDTKVEWLTNLNHEFDTTVKEINRISYKNGYDQGYLEALTGRVMVSK